MSNCHGCKYLDEYEQKGRGYCAMVTRSKSYDPGGIRNNRLTPSSKCRKPDMERCELYEEGNFEERFK